MTRKSPRRPHGRLGALEFQGLPASAKRTKPKGENRSFMCPVCKGGTAVIDSRPRGSGVRRRRACLDGDCGCRFTTQESIILADGDYDTRLQELLGLVTGLKTQLAAVENALTVAITATTFADDDDEVT